MVLILTFETICKRLKKKIYFILVSTLAFSGCQIFHPKEIHTLSQPILEESKGYITKFSKITKNGKWRYIKIAYLGDNYMLKSEFPINNDKSGNKFIEINKDTFYVEWNQAPTLTKNGVSENLCNDLQKIKFDNGIYNYGDPVVVNYVCAILLIDKYGTLKYYGFYIPPYYFNYTLNILKVFDEYKNHYKFIPAQLNKDSVGCILRISGFVQDYGNNFSFGWIFQDTPNFVTFPNLNCREKDGR